MTYHPTESSLSLTDRVACMHAMSCVAWADGHLHADEVTAARAAAMILGLEGRAVQRRPLRRIPRHALSIAGRKAVYASAVWMAIADGIFDHREHALLSSLQRFLVLDEDDRILIEDLVYTMTIRVSESWPTRYRDILDHLLADEEPS